MSSILSAVLAADNFPACNAYPNHHPDTGEVYVPFHIAPSDSSASLPPVGLLRPEVLKALEGDEGYESVQGDNGVECVTFAATVLAGGREAMNSAIAQTAARWRKAGLFKAALDGWRDELYAIYASPKSAAFSSPPRGGWHNAAFACERAACAVFGFATFGVHMTAYEGEGENMKIWVPRRSPTKATWPGMLDNVRAEGCELTKERGRRHYGRHDAARYHGQRVRRGGVAPCQPRRGAAPKRRPLNVLVHHQGRIPAARYLYDLPLPPRDSPDYVLPHPHDDEVESFHLMSVPEAMEALHRGEFKPNCGIILVDFLIRHSFITPENEPDYIELCWHMRRRLGMAMPA